MRINIKIPVITFVILAAISVESSAAVEWNVSLWGKKRLFTEHIERLAYLVKRKTKGTFVIKLHYGEALSKSRENLDGLSIGAFEMAQFCVGYHRDKNPLLTVLELPFFEDRSLEDEIKISRAVFNHPAVKKDLAKWKAMLLMPTPLPQYNLAGVGKPPASVLDFRNIKIRTTGSLDKTFMAMGSTPKPLAPTEIPKSLKNGAITSAAFTEHAHLTYRTFDVATWWISNLNPGTVSCPVAVNIDAFNKLSKSHKKALLDSVPPALGYYTKKYNQIKKRKFQPLLKKKKIKKVIISTEVIEELRSKIALAVRNDWIKSMKSRNLPGKDLIDLILKETQK